MLWRRLNYFRNYFSKAVDSNPNSKVMNDIFVCYRRADSAEVTERICDHIKNRFQSATIFKDVDSIPPGVDFRTHIAEQI